MGDVNVHHKTWLRRSARDSAEGEELHKFALDAGMQQLVRGATRNQYLLDLVISDVEGLRCQVLSKIADHALVLTRMNLPVPESEIHERMVWRYQKADWVGLRAGLATIDWQGIVSGAVDSAAEKFSQILLDTTKVVIPRSELRERKVTHPWVNDEVVELVRQKHLCAGTVDEQKACETCSAGIRKEFWKYVSKEKERLLREPPASKGWWSMTRRLLGQQEKVCSLPALKTTEGEWCRDAKSKADHLAVTFKAKYKMPEKHQNIIPKLKHHTTRSRGRLER